MAGAAEEIVLEVAWANVGPHAAGSPQFTVVSAKGVPEGLWVRARFYYGDKDDFDEQEEEHSTAEAQCRDGRVDWTLLPLAARTVQFDFEAEQWLRVELYTAELLLGRAEFEFQNDAEESGSRCVAVAVTADEEALSEAVAAAVSRSPTQRGAASPTSASASPSPAASPASDSRSPARSSAWSPTAASAPPAPASPGAAGAPPAAEAPPPEPQAGSLHSEGSPRPVAGGTSPEARPSPAGSGSPAAAASPRGAGAEAPISPDFSQGAAPSEPPITPGALQGSPRPGGREPEQQRAAPQEQDAAEPDAAVRAEFAEKDLELRTAELREEEDKGREGVAAEETRRRSQAAEQLRATRPPPRPREQPPPESEAEAPPPPNAESPTSPDDSFADNDAAAAAAASTAASPGGPTPAAGSPRTPPGHGAAAAAASPPPAVQAASPEAEPCPAVEWEVLRCRVHPAAATPGSSLCVAVAGSRSSPCPPTAQGEALCSFRHHVTLARSAFPLEILRLGCSHGGGSEQLLGQATVTLDPTVTPGEWAGPVWCPLQPTAAGGGDPHAGVTGVELRWRAFPSAAALREQQLQEASLRAEPFPAGTELEVFVAWVEGLPEAPATPAPATSISVAPLATPEEEEECGQPPHAVSLPELSVPQGRVLHWEWPVRLPAARLPGGAAVVDVYRGGMFHGRATVEAVEARDGEPREALLPLLPRRSGPSRYRLGDLERWSASGGSLGSVRVAWRFVDAAAERAAQAEREELLRRPADPGAVLRLTVTGATGLAPADFGGKTSSPRVVALHRGVEVARSLPARKTLNPDWDFSVDLPLATRLNEVVLQVRNDTLLDAQGEETFLGECTVVASADGPSDDEAELRLQPRRRPDGACWEPVDLVLLSRYGGLLGRLAVRWQVRKREAAAVPSLLTGPPLVARVRIECVMGLEAAGLPEHEPVRVVVESGGRRFETAEAPLEQWDETLIARWAGESELQLPAGVETADVSVSTAQGRRGTVQVRLGGSSAADWYQLCNPQQDDEGAPNVGVVRVAFYATRRPACALPPRRRLGVTVVRGENIPHFGAGGTTEGGGLLACTLRLCPCGASYPRGALPDGVDAPLVGRAETAAATLVSTAVPGPSPAWNAFGGFELPRAEARAASGTTAVLWVMDFSSKPAVCLGSAVLSLPDAGAGQQWVELQPRTGQWRAEDERRRRFAGGLGRVLVTWEAWECSPADLSMAICSLRLRSGQLASRRLVAKFAVGFPREPPVCWLFRSPTALGGGDDSAGDAAHCSGVVEVTASSGGPPAAPIDVVSYAGSESAVFVTLWYDGGIFAGCGQCSLGAATAGSAAVELGPALGPPPYHHRRGCLHGTLSVRWRWIVPLPPPPPQWGELELPLPRPGDRAMDSQPLVGPALGLAQPLPPGWRARLLRGDKELLHTHADASATDPLLAGAVAWSRRGDVIRIEPPAGGSVSPDAVDGLSCTLLCVAEAAAGVGGAITADLIRVHTPSKVEVPTDAYASVYVECGSVRGPTQCSRVSGPSACQAGTLWEWAERFVLALPSQPDSHGASGGAARPGAVLCIRLYDAAAHGLLAAAELPVGGGEGDCGAAAHPLLDSAGERWGTLLLSWHAPRQLPHEPLITDAPREEEELSPVGEGPEEVAVAHVLQTDPKREPHTVSGATACLLHRLGLVLVLGGVNELKLYEPLAQEYSTKTACWETHVTSGPPVLRDGHTAVVYDGTRVIVYGGWGPGGLNPAFAAAAPPRRGTVRGTNTETSADALSQSNAPPQGREGAAAAPEPRDVSQQGRQPRARPAPQQRGAAKAKQAERPRARAKQPEKQQQVDKREKAQRTHTFRHALALASQAGDSSSATCGYHMSVHEFDPQQHTWRELQTEGSARDYRAGHSAVMLGHKMLVWGGWQLVVEERRPRDDGPLVDPQPSYRSIERRRNDMAVLDLERCRWKHVQQQGALPRARSGHTAVRISTRPPGAAAAPVRTQMWIFGGATERLNSDPIARDPGCDGAEPPSDSDDDVLVRERSRSPSPRKLGATLSRRERQLQKRARYAAHARGASDQAPEPRVPSAEVCLGDLHVFDVATKEWAPAPQRGAARPAARQRHSAAAVCADGRSSLLIYGGFGNDGRPLGCCYQYVFASALWRCITFRCRAPPPRGCHCAALLPIPRNDQLRQLRKKRQEETESAEHGGARRAKPRQRRKEEGDSDYEGGGATPGRAEMKRAAGPPAKAMRAQALPPHDAPIFQLLVHGGTGQCAPPAEGSYAPAATVDRRTVILNFGAKEAPEMALDPRKPRGKVAVASPERAATSKAPQPQDLAAIFERMARTMPQSKVKCSTCKAAQDKNKHDKDHLKAGAMGRLTAQRQREHTDRLYYKPMSHAQCRAELIDAKQRKERDALSKKLETDALVINVERLYYQATARHNESMKRRRQQDEDNIRAATHTKLISREALEKATDRLFYQSVDERMSKARELELKWSGAPSCGIVRTRDEWLDTVARLSAPAPHMAPKSPSVFDSVRGDDD